MLKINKKKLTSKTDIELSNKRHCLNQSRKIIILIINEEIWRSWRDCESRERRIERAGDSLDVIRVIILRFKNFYFLS